MLSLRLAAAAVTTLLTSAPVARADQPAADGTVGFGVHYGFLSAGFLDKPTLHGPGARLEVGPPGVPLDPRLAVEGQYLLVDTVRLGATKHFIEGVSARVELSARPWASDRHALRVGATFNYLRTFTRPVDDEGVTLASFLLDPVSNRFLGAAVTWQTRLTARLSVEAKVRLEYDLTDNYLRAIEDPPAGETESTYTPYGMPSRWASAHLGLFWR